jgi:transposase/predicted DNA binding CopG/RHH family protein
MKSKEKLHNHVVFKPYNNKQILLLPPSLEELIAENHPVRVVNSVIDSLDISLLESNYESGGTSSYHPRMLLKVVVYSYLQNIYSSRGMENGLKEHIHMMWLSGMSYPDHNTLNRFRSHRLKDSLKEIFRQVVLLLVESGHISLKSIYTDGTKIEANANKYTFVWGKSIETNKKKLYAQIEELWRYTEGVASEEMADKQLPAFEQIDAQKVRETITTLNEALKEQIANKTVDTKKVDKLKYAEKNYPQKLEEYAVKEQILNGRNSYSKTDEDATFMRLKEDHMENGQLKAAYNGQISTENQFIVHYSIHQSPTDTTTLISHMEGLREQFGDVVEEQTADAGYGSEENYVYLEEHNIDAYIKFNQFHNEQKTTFKNKIGHIDNLHYNPEGDYFVCPMGQHMTKVGVHKQKTKTGFEQTITRYQAQRCEHCPLRGICFEAKGNRVVQVNHNLRRLKAKAREKLQSEKGIEHRKKRPCDVEPVFGNIKNNHYFKRFRLRSLVKVEIELGLVALAHNLRKKAAA